MIYVILLYIILNIAGFIIMDIDKRKAIKKEERIPEACLFLIAVFFGALGVLIYMYLGRHKNRKWYFNAGIPAILIQNAATLYSVYIIIKK